MDKTGLKQMSLFLPPDLVTFWEMKKEHLQANAKVKSSVTNSTMFQALVAFWRAMDSGSLDDDFRP